MEDLLLHLEYSKTMVYIILGTMLLTYIVHFFFKKYRFAKYMPGFFLIFIGFYSLFNRYGSTKLLGVDNIFIAISIFISGIIGMCFAWILGVYNKDKKKKNKKEKNKKENIKKEDIKDNKII